MCIFNKELLIRIYGSTCRQLFSNRMYRIIHITLFLKIYELKSSYKFLKIKYLLSNFELYYILCVITYELKKHIHCHLFLDFNSRESVNLCKTFTHLDSQMKNVLVAIMIPKFPIRFHATAAAAVAGVFVAICVTARLSTGESTFLPSTRTVRSLLWCTIDLAPRCQLSKLQYVSFL